MFKNLYFMNYMYNAIDYQFFLRIIMFYQKSPAKTNTRGSKGIQSLTEQYRENVF